MLICLKRFTRCLDRARHDDRVWTVTIRYSWWGADEWAKKVNRTIALFEKKYPKTKVKADFQTYQSFWEKFQTQAVGVNALRCSQNAVTFLLKYDEPGILLALKSQVGRAI